MLTPRQLTSTSPQNFPKHLGITFTTLMRTIMGIGTYSMLPSLYPNPSVFSNNLAHSPALIYFKLKFYPTPIYYIQLASYVAATLAILSHYKQFSKTIYNSLPTNTEDAAMDQPPRETQPQIAKAELAAVLHDLSILIASHAIAALFFEGFQLAAAELFYENISIALLGFLAFNAITTANSIMTKDLYHRLEGLNPYRFEPLRFDTSSFAGRFFGQLTNSAASGYLAVAQDGSGDQSDVEMAANAN